MDFIIDTLFQIFFCFFWVIGLVIILFDKKNRKKYICLTFLIPLLMVWSSYSYINILKPRFSDISYYIDKNYEVSIGKCNTIKGGSRGMTPSFILDENTYYYNPRFNKISEGNSYKLKYLPNSKYVIDTEIIK